MSTGVPVDVGSLCSNRQTADSATIGDITLAYCHACSLVSNRTFDHSRIAFRPGYDAGLEHSPLIRHSVDRTIDTLISKFALQDRRILEIGCGNGYVLRRICEHGNRGVGIDPTAPHERYEKVGSGEVQFIRDFYSERYQDVQFDFLFCQSVLEDIRHPGTFLSAVQSAVARQKAKVYFEVFNASRSFEHQETFSIHYEQCNYFTLRSLTKLFQRAGFRPLEAGVVPGNEQYIFIEATCDSRESCQALADHSGSSGRVPAVLTQFSASHLSKVKRWRERLSQLRTRGGQAVVWGTGGKGVSFLNAVGAESGIRYVVDINPQRQGLFIPRSGQQVVPPAFLTEIRPNLVVVTNAAYEREIREQIAQLQLQPEILIA